MNTPAKSAYRLLELIESTVMNDHTVEVARKVVEAWRSDEEAKQGRVSKLETKEQMLCDRIEAMKVLKKELESEVGELRQTYQAQLMTSLQMKVPAWDDNQANYIRAARLLIEPGKPITPQTLTALGLSSPPRGTRPTEHWVRSIATIVLPTLGFQVLHAQGAHPDLICDYNGQTIGVEVEVALKDYNSHGHDSADAHMIVIWTNPMRGELTDEGYFQSAKCTEGFSNRLAVITLQTPTILGSWHGIGNKRALSKVL